MNSNLQQQQLLSDIGGKSQNESLRLQFNRLERRINSQTSQLRVDRQKLLMLKSNVAKFFNHYYHSTKNLLVELELIENSIKTGSAYKPSINLNAEYNDLCKPSEGLDFSVELGFVEPIECPVLKEQCKKSYRNLVKFCHPDSYPEDIDAKIIFTMVSAAHEANDLVALISIERAVIEAKQEAQPLTIHAKLEALKAELDDISGEHDCIKLQIYNITNSEKYKLYSSYKESLQKGKNLIEKVKRNLLIEINIKKAKLA